MTPPKAVLLLALLLAGGLSVAFVAPGAVPAFLNPLTERLDPPPSVRLVSPAPGMGVTQAVVVTGEAHSTARDLLDVQVRVDDGRWASVDAVRGARATPFETQLVLPPGDHVIEARAYDGLGYSAPARATVRVDAPTVLVATPSDGASVPSGRLVVSGTVVGLAHAVLVSVDGRETFATLVGTTWTATVDVEPGVRNVTVQALARVPSLPRVVRVAADGPSLAIASPVEGATYGGAGDLACGSACILFAGATSGARVDVAIDGIPTRSPASVAGAAWTYRLPFLGLASGVHDATFTPYDAAGRPGVPRSVSFVARTPVTLALEGDDAPRPTGESLRFRATGDHAATARWTLDGEPVATGDTVTLALTTPGDHVLAATTTAPDGRAATAGIGLHAINRPPTVALATNVTGVPGAVELHAAALDEDGNVTRYVFEMGDGNRRDTAHPSIRHRYSRLGTYAVNVTAYDDRGAFARVGGLVAIVDVGPLADFSWTPASPSILDVVTLHDASVDPEGGNLTRSWSLADGRASEDAAPTFKPTTRGEHLVTLRVEDVAGAVASVTKAIPVRDLPPVPRFRHEPAAPLTHQEVTFHDESSDPDGPLAGWSWRFGENATASGRSVVHAFRTPGEHNVTLTVVDDWGLASNVTLLVRVTDSPPTVRGVEHSPPKPLAHEEVRFHVAADDRDGGIVQHVWEFGDGTTGEGATPAHAYPRSGAYHGRVRVLDEGGLNASLPFTVFVGNAPPRVDLALASGGHARFPTVLAADARDADGRIVRYRFDAESDGLWECVTTEPRCEVTYLEPGAAVARVVVEDDEGGVASNVLLVDVLAPPSSLAPPLLRIDAPMSGATLRGDHLVRGDVTGVRPILRVELQVRNDSFALSDHRDVWRLANGNASWTALLDTRILPDGDHELVVRAIDADGGVGLARLPIRIQNGPRESDVSIRLLDAPESLEESVIVRASAFHPEGITSLRWRLDDGPAHLVTANPLAFTIPLDRARLAPGLHELRIEAHRGTQENATLVHVFRVPGARPALVVDEPPPPEAHGLLRASGRILGEGRAQWRLDHGLWHDLPLGGTWTLHEETLRIRGGNHTLHLRAVSPDGLLASEPASYRLFIKNPPFLPENPREPPSWNATPSAGWLALAAAALAAAAVRRRGPG